MEKTVFRGLRLDVVTNEALRELAELDAQGNASFLVRQLVKDAAERRGVWPVAQKSGQTTQRPQECSTPG